MDLYRMGNSSDAKLMEDRYREVINDEEFLNFISKNAREYYLKNCEIENNVKRTFNLYFKHTQIKKK
jgi:glycosyltransferase involved in cell wall biosynthesis